MCVAAAVEVAVVVTAVIAVIAVIACVFFTIVSVFFFVLFFAPAAEVVVPLLTFPFTAPSGVLLEGRAPDFYALLKVRFGSTQSCTGMVRAETKI